MTHDALSTGDAARRSFTALSLCALTAILEGVDIQSGGLAAPKLRTEFGLEASQLGLVLSMSIIGLLCGALVGGRLSDRIGKKAVLILSVLILGLFSLLTAAAWDYSSLLAIRFLAGLGMGGAMPCLISIAAEAAGQRYRATGVSLMFAGLPIGGALASAFAAYGGEAMDWRVIFYLGGVLPLILAPVLWYGLPETAQQRAGTTVTRALTPLGRALFGEGRAPVTLVLWLSYFCTLIVLYLLLNWLPSLMVEKGLSRPEAFAVVMLLNLGGALGAVLLGWLFDRLGLLFDKSGRMLVAALTYGGMIVALAMLSSVSLFPAALVGGALAGFFVMGGQAIIYSLAPPHYPSEIRGTGVGTAVAVGRIGSISGPLLAGQLLSSGFGPAAIMMMAIPMVAVGGLAVIWLSRKRTVDQLAPGPVADPAMQAMYQ